VLARELNRFFGRFEVLDHLLTHDHRHSVELHDIAQLTDLPLEVQEPCDVGQVPAATTVAVLGEALQFGRCVRDQHWLAELGDLPDRNPGHGAGDDDHVDGPIGERLLQGGLSALQSPVRLGLDEDDGRILLHELQNFGLEQALPFDEQLRLAIGDQHDPECRP